MCSPSTIEATARLTAWAFELTDTVARLEALADQMETPGYLADSDGWGHVAAREIRATIRKEAPDA